MKGMKFRLLVDILDKPYHLFLKDKYKFWGNVTRDEWTEIITRIYACKTQKELLEDAIIIYRIQRAPERRIFYIDIAYIRIVKEVLLKIAFLA